MLGSVACGLSKHGNAGYAPVPRPRGIVLSVPSFPLARPRGQNSREKVTIPQWVCASSVLLLKSPPTTSLVPTVRLGANANW